MQRMSSFNPYIFKAFYDWLVDNEITPHLLVNAEVKGVQVPQSYVRNGKIVLSIAARAVRNFSINQKDISFYARFSGQDEFIVIPYNAMLDLIAVENEIRYPLEMCLTPDPDDEDEDEEGDKESSDEDNVVGFSTVDDSTDEQDESQDENEKKDNSPSFTILKDD